MLEALSKYYGLDWIGMIGSLYFLFLIGNKKRYGFIVFSIANMAWLVVNYMAQIWPGVIVCTIIIGLNIRDYIKWEK